MIHVEISSTKIMHCWTPLLQIFKNLAGCSPRSRNPVRFFVVSKTKLTNQESAFFANSKISKMCGILVDQFCCAKNENLTELLSIFFFYFHKSGNSISLFVITITAIFVNCLILSSFYFPVEWNCVHWWWVTHFNIFDSVLKIQPVIAFFFSISKE